MDEEADSSVDNETDSCLWKKVDRRLERRVMLN